METLNFKVGSKKVVVAAIDYSELEMLQKGSFLKPCDIIKIVEDAVERELPQHDIREVDGKNKILTLYAHVNWVEKL
jgi:hypothetical protein